MPIMGSLVMDPSTKMFSAQIRGNCSQPRSNAAQKAAVLERWQLHFELVINFNHCCGKPTAKSVFPALRVVCITETLAVLIKCYLLSWQVSEAGFPAKVSDKSQAEIPIRERWARKERKKRQKKMRQLKEKNPQLNKKEICQNLKWGKKTHRWWQTWANAGMKWVWELKLNSVK